MFLDASAEAVKQVVNAIEGQAVREREPHYIPALPSMTDIAILCHTSYLPLYISICSIYLSTYPSTHLFI